MKPEESETSHPATGKKRKLSQTKTSKNKKQKLDENMVPNPLDMTNIHPESYDIADRYKPIL